MCGLVGVMGHITIVEKAVFQQLLLVDTIRGKHSTGIAAIDHVGDVTVFKRAVNALDFFDFKQYDRTMLYSSNCLMGHNRYATAGEVNNTNASMVLVCTQRINDLSLSQKLDKTRYSMP